ncbi:hypothetical protein BC828DRAFT_389908 [Blastocladiella britannica]|nr:hypothetical protein BC828DRAFT_389908 [Blastocladiella britannica]
MRAAYVRPENALQRAEELVAVNTPGEALNVLEETLTNRRTRGAVIPSVEPLALRFIELAVDLNRPRTAREGLHAFKNLAQNTAVASVEKVIRRFLERAELKLREAKQNLEKNTAAKAAAVIAVDDEAVEDLEASDSFESILQSVITSVIEGTAAPTTVDGEAAKAAKRDRDAVTARLKFLWEAYRTVLEVLRNNAKLELLYQQTVAQAFAFCQRDGRKNEFRRLCETLRTHLASLPRAASQHNGISLTDPEVLQRFLDTRFMQLQTASDMELWQESFRSVEDIYQLLLTAGSLIAPPHPGQVMAGFLPAALFANKRHGAKMTQMVAQYHEKLTHIFEVSDDRLFQAAAWNKYMSWVSTVKGAHQLSEADQSRVAGHVVLSALAAPVLTDAAAEAEAAGSGRFNRKTRLTQLLGLSSVPDRASLLAAASSKFVLAGTTDTIRSLYEAMEPGFHPLTVAEQVRPALAALESDAVFAKYVPHLRAMVVAKVVKAISAMYSSISFDTLRALTTVGSNNSGSATQELFDLERVMVRGAQMREFSIKVNHREQTFEFSTEVETPELASLFEMPLFDRFIAEEKQSIFAKARSEAKEEHRAALQRQALIEQKKEQLEQAQFKKEREEAADRARKAAAEREALQQKMIEDAKARELERLREEQDAIKKAEARKIAEALRAKSGVKIADADLDNMDTTAIFAVQAEQIKKEREAIDAKMLALAKRSDYLERAIRKEEVPLLIAAREQQKVADRAAFEEARRLVVHKAQERHAEALAIKHRVVRMLSDYQAYRVDIDAARSAEMAAAEAEAAEKLAAAKDARREAVRAALRKRIVADEERRAADRKRQQEALMAAEREGMDDDDDLDFDNMSDMDENAPAARLPAREALPERAAPVIRNAQPGAWVPKGKPVEISAVAPSAAATPPWGKAGAARSSGSAWTPSTGAGGSPSSSARPSAPAATAAAWRGSSDRAATPSDSTRPPMRSALPMADSPRAPMRSSVPLTGTPMRSTAPPAGGPRTLERASPAPAAAAAGGTVPWRPKADGAAGGGAATPPPPTAPKDGVAASSSGKWVPPSRR